jgi:hypothetical protein
MHQKQDSTTYEVVFSLSRLSTLSTLSTQIHPNKKVEVDETFFCDPSKRDRKSEKN